MKIGEHEELQTLLGAYALNAVDEMEHRRITKHLSTCEDCRREVRLLSLPASELAFLPDPADEADDLIDRITEALPWRPRRTFNRAVAAVAAVAVIAAGSLGVVLRNERAAHDRLVNIVATADRQVKLSAQKGFDGSGRVYIAGDEGVLLLEDVPDAGRDRAYQLWALVGAKPTSVAVVDGADDVNYRFDWDGKADRFAVTIEPAGGSPVPTTDPVLVGG